VPVDRSASTDETVATPVTDGLQLILEVDRVSYPPGATIRARIQVVNRLNQPRTLSFSSGQRVDAVLEDESGAEVVRWSDGHMFTQALGEERFEPGDEGRAWDLELVAPEVTGSYRLRGFLTAMEGTLEASLPVEVVDGNSPNPDDTQP
jgi:hypothetical protein